MEILRLSVCGLYARLRKSPYWASNGVITKHFCFVQIAFILPQWEEDQGAIKTHIILASMTNWFMRSRYLLKAMHTNFCWHRNGWRLTVLYRIFCMLKPQIVKVAVDDRHRLFVLIPVFTLTSDLLIWQCFIATAVSWTRNSR